MNSRRKQPNSKNKLNWYSGVPWRIFYRYFNESGSFVEAGTQYILPIWCLLVERCFVLWGFKFHKFPQEAAAVLTNYLALRYGTCESPVIQDYRQLILRQTTGICPTLLHAWDEERFITITDIFFLWNIRIQLWWESSSIYSVKHAARDSEETQQWHSNSAELWSEKGVIELCQHSCNSFRIIINGLENLLNFADLFLDRARTANFRFSGTNRSSIDRNGSYTILTTAAGWQPKAN